MPGKWRSQISKSHDPHPALGAAPDYLIFTYFDMVASETQTKLTDILEVILKAWHRLLCIK